MASSDAAENLEGGSPRDGSRGGRRRKVVAVVVEMVENPEEEGKGALIAELQEQLRVVMEGTRK
jgi:hypothetical protein